ncbi:MAG: LysR substrate-binding domain-containing protein, partial [Spirochaetales bacterium]|nr:LysR substrate-binding domain-containing protein [Spirochaetales bacterium]
GLVDVVVSPHKGNTKGIKYTPVSQENIVLAAGKDQDSGPFDSAKKMKKDELLSWLKSQKWYGITGDNEHLKRFWKLNFKTHPDFRPNYIVPNIHSVVRGLSSGSGLAVLPDFLCREAIKQGNLRIIWSGKQPLTNTLFLASRTHAVNEEQIQKIELILRKELPELKSN